MWKRDQSVTPPSAYGNQSAEAAPVDRRSGETVVMDLGKSVVIKGAVIGNVTARERVEIRATGSVTGDIRSPRLAVADGGYLRGRVEMTDSSQVAGAGARPAGI